MSTVSDESSGDIPMSPLTHQGSNQYAPPIIASPLGFSFSQRFQRVTNRLRIATLLNPNKPDLQYSTEGWHDTPNVAEVNLSEAEPSPSRRVASNTKPGKHRTQVYIWSRRTVISNWWQFLSFSMTMLALFLDPMRDAWLSLENDDWVNGVLFASLMFFCVEMTLLSIAEKNYFNSFFFWLDFLGSVSLVFDIPWLVRVVAPEELGILPLLRGAKAARAGARATRLVRLVRLIRLVRFVKVLSFFNGTNLDEEEVNEKLQPKPSRVGELLSEQISRRVVVLVLLVLFVAPQLQVETDQLTSQQLLLKAMRAMPDDVRQEFIDDYYLTHTGGFVKVLYLEVAGTVYVTEPNDIKDKYRPQEVFSLGVNPSASLRKKISSGGIFNGCGGDKNGDCTLVKFDDSYYAQEDGKFSCLLILFMIFLLSFGSYLFTQVAKKLAVAPIERMLAVVDIVSESLHALKRDGDRFSKEDKDRDKTLEEELGDADEPEADYEISFLEEAVLKMAELLHMGYGAAGTEIIQRNLGISDGNVVETFIAGTKLNAVFAFCDIRKFTDTTEVLQENVLRFVNLVGHVVHSNTEWFEGSPNKNIGDAFLLVWKMTKMAQKRMIVQRQASAMHSPSESLSPDGIRGTMKDFNSPDSDVTSSNISMWAAPTSPHTFDEDQAFSTIRPSTRQRGDTKSLAQRLAPGVVEMMPTTTYNLFPEFHSVRDESTAITLADGCLKAMVQTAFDLDHLNSIPQTQLLEQVIALDTVKMESDTAAAAAAISAVTSSRNKGKSLRTRNHKRRSNAWGKWINNKISPHSSLRDYGGGGGGLSGFMHRRSQQAVAPSHSPSSDEDRDAREAGLSTAIEFGMDIGLEIEEQKDIEEGNEDEEEEEEDDNDISPTAMYDEASPDSPTFPPLDQFDGIHRTLSEMAFEVKKKEFASRIGKTLIAAGRKIALGYGMHFGWAIEGAIGSNLKIDASYLSPHVNTAARLEAATKQFGTMFLMSEEFVQQLSPKNQNLCRKIDNVILVGKNDPTPLYTWDMWLGPPKRQGHMGCHRLSPLHVLNNVANAAAAGANVTMVMPAAHLSPEIAPKMFVDMFGMGFRAYQVGSWDMAARTLRRCLEIVPADGPTLSLLDVIEKHDFKAPQGWDGYRHLTDK